MKASNPSVTSVVAPSPALVAFFTEANRLAGVVGEREAARQNGSVLPVSVDAESPLIQPIPKPLGSHSPRPAWFISAKPKPALSAVVSINPPTARSLLVVQFNPQTRRPRPKLTFSSGE